jgi:hypothetical protein
MTIAFGLRYLIRFHGKKRVGDQLPYYDKLVPLVSEKIIDIRSCLNHPAVFTTLLKMGLRTLEQWRYEPAPHESIPHIWLNLILKSKMLTRTKDEIICFLRKYGDDRYIPIDAESIKLIIRAKKCRVFREWMTIVDLGKMDFGIGRNILHEMIQWGGHQFEEFIPEFEDLLTQCDMGGTYPVEYLLRRPSALCPKNTVMICNALNIIADKNAEFKALKKRFTAKKYMIMKPDWLYRFTLEGIFDYKNFDQTMSELQRTWINITKTRLLKQPDLLEFPFQDLPKDLFYSIVDYISLTTIMALSLASKTVHRYIQSDPFCWKRIVSLTRPLIENTNENSKWRELARDYSRIEYGWYHSKIKQIVRIPSSTYTKILGVDDNYVAYFDDSTNGMRIWSFHSQCSLPLKYECNAPVTILQSCPYQEPYFVSVNGHSVYVMHNNDTTMQDTGVGNHYKIPSRKVTAMDDSSVYLQHTDLIWDIEASKIRMKLDFPPIDSNIGVISVYNRSSKMLVTEVNEVLQLVDVRSGKIISPINIKARSTGFLDNNTMALTTTQGILKLDLRNFQQRSILTGNWENYRNWIDGKNSRLIVHNNTTRGSMCWDLREENWRKITFGSELNMLEEINSHSAIGFSQERDQMIVVQF